ncbi:MAG: bacterial transcriptional activator domain-containing protein, partial [Polyangiaceae bacterium]
DAEGDGGRRVFDTTLYRLRRSIGDDALLRLVDGKLHLDDRLCWVDLWAFEELLTKVDKAIAPGGQERDVIDLAERLLDLYRGPLLADTPAPSAHLLRPRAALSTKFFRAAGKLGQALETHQQFDQAALLYQRAAEGEDALELAYAGLIRCALGSGRHAEGVRLYEQCRSRMIANLGEEPGPALAQLYATLGAPPLLPPVWTGGRAVAAENKAHPHRQ